MIYLDSSVALAYLLTEERTPPPSFWDTELISSRLLEYEVWNRAHAQKLVQPHRDTVRSFLAGVSFIEFAPPVLERALEPFPIPVRTLDALHLATVEFVRTGGRNVSLATYDRRLARAANALGIGLAVL